MVNIDIEAFKKEGFSYEEIQEITESIEEFEKTWIVYDFEDLKKLSRKTLFSNNKECIK